MERTCFAEVQNWLCSYWWLFLWVKWLMKALTPSPCLSFETWKLQLCWTFVKEGLTSVRCCCCVVKTCVFQVLSARNGLFQSTGWLEGFGYSWACPGCPILPLPTAICPLLKPSALLLQRWLSQRLCEPQLGGKRKLAHFPSSWKKRVTVKIHPAPRLISSPGIVVYLWVPYLMCCLGALWFIIPDSRDNFTSCNTHVGNCQVSSLLHLATDKFIFLPKAVSVTCLHQAGCLSMGVLCVAVNLKSMYESGILLKLDWESVVMLFSVPRVWTEILSCSFCPKPLNGRCWRSVCLREGKGLEDGRREGEELRFGQFSVCSDKLTPLMNGDLNPHLITSLRLTVSHPRALVVAKLKKFCYVTTRILQRVLKGVSFYKDREAFE